MSPLVLLVTRKIVKQEKFTAFLKPLDEAEKERIELVLLELANNPDKAKPMPRHPECRVYGFVRGKKISKAPINLHNPSPEVSWVFHEFWLFFRLEDDDIIFWHGYRIGA